jgi:hypothetical protein
MAVIARPFSIQKSSTPSIALCTSGLRSEVSL